MAYADQYSTVRQRRSTRNYARIASGFNAFEVGSTLYKAHTELPWRNSHHDGTRVANRLAGYINSHGRRDPIQTADIVELYNSHAKSGEPLEIKWLGPRSYQIIGEVFKNVGIILPSVKTKSSTT